MDDDDLGDQGKKTNTSPVHKPAHARQYDMAPGGTVGRRAGGLPGVTNKGPDQQHQVDPKIDFRKGQSQEKEDNRPIAVKTGDKDVDRDSVSQGQRLMSMDDIKAQGHRKSEEQQQSGPRISQSDFAKAFRQAHGKTQGLQQSKGVDPD